MAELLQFCDICLRRPSTVGTLLISSCRHVFCRRCAKSSTICSTCEQPCRIIEFRREKFPTALKDYFSSGIELLWNAFKVTKFQAERLDRFISAKSGVLEKYNKKKQRVLMLKEYYDSFNKCINDEIAAIRNLRARRKSTNVLEKLPPGVLFLPEMDSLRISTLKKNTEALTDCAFRPGMKRTSTTDTSTQPSSAKKSALQSKGASSFNVFMPSIGNKPLDTVDRSCKESKGLNSNKDKLIDNNVLKRTNTFDKGSSHNCANFVSSQISYTSSAKDITPSNCKQTSSPRTGTGSKSSAVSTEAFKKPIDLVSSARDGIYQEAVRNIGNATKKNMQPVQKFTSRGSDIERARNAFF